MNRVESKRIEWLDSLRGLAMFIVILGHSFPTNKYTIRKYIYSFHMPLFFFISGMTFKDTNISLKEFIKKKSKSYLIPYLALNIGCLILRTILGLFNVLPKINILESLLGIIYGNDIFLDMPSGPSWFLLTLYISEIIYFLIKKYSKSDQEVGIKVSILTIIAYLDYLSGYSVNYPWHFNTALMSTAFLFLGNMLAKNLNKIEGLKLSKIKQLSLGFIFFVISLVCCYFNRRVSLYANLYGSIVLFLICATSAFLGLVLFTKLFLIKDKILNIIGKRTLLFLGYQNVLITVLEKNINFPLSNTIVNNIAIFAVSIVATIILFLLSIPIYKYCPILIGKIDKNK